VNRITKPSRCIGIASSPLKTNYIQMKKSVLMFLLCLIASFGAFSQKQPTITLSKAEKGKIELRLALKSPGTIAVDWGNNKPKNYEINASAKIAEATVISESVAENAIVKIYADDLIFLYCREQVLATLNLQNAQEIRVVDCAINNLTELNTSKNAELNYLNCHKNNLKELDLSTNPKIKTLNCSYNSLEQLNLSNNKILEHVSVFENKISSLTLSTPNKINTLLASKNKLSTLDMAGATSLTYLDINTNLFDACALNKVFAALAVNKKASDGTANLKINHNAGAATSNTAIAEEKNWVLDRKGKGNANCN